MPDVSLYRLSQRLTGDGDDWAIDAAVLASSKEQAAEMADVQVRTLRQANAWPADVPASANWTVQETALDKPGVLSLVANRVTDSGGERAQRSR